jgi:hypothetical protein
MMLFIFQDRSFVFTLTQNIGSELKTAQGGVEIISELRVGLQYDCTLSGCLPALPLLLSGDCIAEVREE